MTRDEIFTVIKANICEIIPGMEGKEILESNSMRDFGADSLQIVEVVSHSMKQLRIKVPRTDLLDVHDLRGLLDLFEKASAKIP
jgi:acyl carrier protein